MVDHLRPEWSDVQAYFARMGQADGVAIHHTASRPTGWTYDPAYLRNLEHGEIARGYNALAYHTMGFLDGGTAESRPYGAMGAATGGHNDHTIAMCAIGYFHDPYHDYPTDALINAFAKEIKQCRDNGRLTPNAIVRPHTWWTAGTQWATSCCGEDFIPFVQEIERRSYLDQPQPEEVQGQMWGIYCRLINGQVEYMHGIGACAQFSVIGDPDPNSYDLPMAVLKYIDYQFGGFPVKLVDPATMAAQKKATMTLTGVPVTQQYKS